MKFLDLLAYIPKLFDWYFNMDLIKRVQLNYIVVIALLLSFTYYNNKTNIETIIVLSNRIDTINNSRTKEQEKYTAKLEYYTDKFNNLLVVLIEQKKELKQIKEEK